MNFMKSGYEKLVDYFIGDPDEVSIKDQVWFFLPLFIMCIIGLITGVAHFSD